MDIDGLSGGAAVPSAAHTTFERRRLEQGDTILLEMTGAFGRYVGPLMRAVSLGEPTPKVRKMAEAFYGRVTAYAAALEHGGEVEAALRRNIFVEQSANDVAALAGWVKESRARLAGQDITEGKVVFA